MKNELSLFSIKDDGSIYDAALKIKNNKTRTLIIVNSNRKVIGVISEGDLLRSLLNYDAPTISVTDVMNRSFQSWSSRSSPGRKQIKDWLREGALLIPVCDSSGVILDVIDVLNEVDNLLNN